MAKRRTIGENPLDVLIPRPTLEKGMREKRPEPSAVESRPEPPRAGGPTAAEVTHEPTAAGTPASLPPTPEAPPAPASSRPAPTPLRSADGDGSPGERGVEPYLTFTLAGEEYAVRVLRVREILEYETITAVPTTPPWIRGVMNLRGSVVPVVDLARKFGLPETAVTKRTCIVILEVNLEGEVAVMGVMTDAVSQVVELSDEEVEKPPAFGTRVHVDYLLGMGRLDERLVLVLDVDRVLSTDELFTASSAPDAASHEAGDPAEATPGAPAEADPAMPADAAGATGGETEPPRAEAGETPRGAAGDGERVG